MAKPSGDGGAGLEGLCNGKQPDWMRIRQSTAGVEYLQAWLRDMAYQKHRHGTYGIGLTDAGLQNFAYRGALHTSAPGQVVVLHPDEAHDGRAGSPEGLAYRLLYVDPGLIYQAVRSICGPGTSLPFLPCPVQKSRKLASAVRGAFQAGDEPLARDNLILQLAEGLLEGAPAKAKPGKIRHLDQAALQRARQFLEAENYRVVLSRELEEISGLDRYELARQFRARFGTSPYRFSLLRRLSLARQKLATGGALADIALETGFADQAHFTRVFKAALGVTPARFRLLGEIGSGATSQGKK